MKAKLSEIRLYNYKNNVGIFLIFHKSIILKLFEIYTLLKIIVRKNYFSCCWCFIDDFWLAKKFRDHIVSNNFLQNTILFFLWYFFFMNYNFNLVLFSYIKRLWDHILYSRYSIFFLAKILVKVQKKIWDQDFFAVLNWTSYPEQSYFAPNNQ